MYTSMHKHLFHNLGRSIVIVQKFVFEYYCIVFLFCFEFFLIFRYVYRRFNAGYSHQIFSFKRLKF